MLILIHGDNEPKSRDLIIQLRAKKDIKDFEEVLLSELSRSEIQNKAAAKNLFDENRLLIIDLARSTSKDAVKLEGLDNRDKKTSIILLANKKLEPKNTFIQIAQEKKIKIVEHNNEIKANVFRLTDGLLNKSRKAAYKELAQLSLEGTDEFYIFAMINQGIRSVTNAKLQTKAWEKSKPFVKGKSQKIAENYDLEVLKDLYAYLLETDYKVKTGKKNMDIALIQLIEKMLQ